MRKLSKQQIAQLFEVYDAGDKGFTCPYRTTTLRSLVDRELIYEMPANCYQVNSRATAQRHLWDAGRIPVDAEFLQELLGMVDVEVDLRLVEGWNTAERREVWAWASARTLRASDNMGVKEPPRPAFLPTTPVATGAGAA